MKKISVLKQSFVLSTALLFFTHCIHAQGTFPGPVGIGTTIPDPSSILDIVSTSQGLLLPRMTSKDRINIVSPATGLLIYQTDDPAGFYYYDGGKWTAVTPKSTGWSLTGNTGTNQATNFIGTTDAQPLVFKVNNRKAGYIGTSSTTNTAFGFQTLNVNTSGVSNVANGYRAMFLNTGGSYNSANGYNALYANAGGYNNTANGATALYSNSEGHNNTANGYRALFTNTTGYYNAAIGAFSLENNIDGIGNTGNGISALRNNTSGNDNIGAGANTLYNNTTGHSNVAVGTNALFKNTIRSNLVAIGDSALYNNDISIFSNISDPYATNNTAIGSKSLYSNSSGFDNTATGTKALYSNASGHDNTANGSHALYTNTNGSYNTATGSHALYSNHGNAHGNASWNTANGYYALYTNYSGFGNTAIGWRALYNSGGSDNTAIGYSADVLIGAESNATVIGAGAYVDASNKVMIGAFSVTSIGGAVGWSQFSDGRYKKNIKEDVKGLSFINSLRPITYTVDINSLNSYYDKGRKHDSAYEMMKADMQPSVDEASKIVHNGFIAQEVEAAAKNLNYDFSGVDKPKSKDRLYGLRYAEFVVPLVKAVQELSSQNEKLKSQNEDLEQRVAKLEGMMNGQQSTTNAKLQTLNISGASLAQNIPNPFSNTTTINYSLPQNFAAAQIIITDKSGKVLKQVNVSGSGKGSVQVNAATLSAGAYQYSLLVDGKLIDTKQMVLAK